MTARKIRIWVISVIWLGLAAIFIASGVYGLLVLSAILDAPA